MVQETKKTLYLPICDACTTILAPMKRAESRGGIIGFFCVPFGMGVGIYAFFNLPFEYVNLGTTLLCMIGGIVGGILLTLLLTRLFFGRQVRLGGGNPLFTWDGDDFHFKNQEFDRRYQEILMR